MSESTAQLSSSSWLMFGQRNRSRTFRGSRNSSNARAVAVGSVCPTIAR
jgi:hypothetical protein